jgi:hypothetical protein
MNRQFVRHYVEMVVVMMVGMFVLGGAAVALLAPFGVDVSSWPSEAPALALLGMAVAMGAPMVAWMRYRGHGWTPAWEMGASMFVPGLATVGLLWGGAVTEIDTLFAIEHVAMFPSMLAVMLLRRDEYSRPHGPAHATA